MARAIKKCICGIPVTTGARIASIYDALSGFIGTVVLIAGLFDLGKTPQFGLYEASWLCKSTATGPLLVVGGIVCVVGIQKKSAAYLNACRGIKLAQVLLAAAGALMVLLNLDEIANQATDDAIADMIEAAKRNHEEPPVIDRDALLLKVAVMLQVLNFGSLTFWLFVGGYVLFLIHSVYHWFSQGVDLDAPEVLIMLPPRYSEQPVRMQYATPLLQGQTPSIPLSIS